MNGNSIKNDLNSIGQAKEQDLDVLAVCDKMFSLADNFLKDPHFDADEHYTRFSWMFESLSTIIHRFRGNNTPFMRKNPHSYAIPELFIGYPIIDRNKGNYMTNDNKDSFHPTSMCVWYNGFGVPAEQQPPDAPHNHVRISKTQYDYAIQVYDVHNCQRIILEGTAKAPSEELVKHFAQAKKDFEYAVTTDYLVKKKIDFFAQQGHDIKPKF